MKGNDSLLSGTERISWAKEEDVYLIVQLSGLTKGNMGTFLPLTCSTSMSVKMAKSRLDKDDRLLLR